MVFLVCYSVCNYFVFWGLLVGYKIFVCLCCYLVVCNKYEFFVIVVGILVRMLVCGSRCELFCYVIV